jgi:hypothetical protein
MGTDPLSTIDSNPLPINGEGTDHHPIKTATSIKIETFRAVTFNKKIRVKAIHFNHNHTREEIDVIWYSRDEYKGIKSNVHATMKKMMRHQGELSSVNKDHNYCTRGIEDRLPAKYRERISHKKAIIRSVLQEQENQRILGIQNPNRISLVYRAQSNRNVATSKRRAALDDEDAKEYYLERQ